MLKQKTSSGWETRLSKPERKRLNDALVVLADLGECVPTAKHAYECVRTIVGCIGEDGVYSEAVPEVAGE